MPDLVFVGDVPCHVTRAPGRSVVVLAELFGITPHVLQVCDRLAAAGFHVICPDLYHRNPGVFEETDAGRARAFAALKSSTLDDYVADIAAATTLATERECGLLGLSVGGHLGFVAATRVPFARIALAYPGWLTSPSPPVAIPRPAIDDLDKITGSVLLVAGEDDFLLTGPEQQVLGERLPARGHRVITYPGVGHGYLCAGRATYDEAAAADTWRQVIAHLH